MKKLFIALVLLVSACVVQTSPNSSPTQPKFDEMRAYKSICGVTATGPQVGENVTIGSCFAVSKDLIISAGHVCSALVANELLPGLVIYGPDEETEVFLQDAVISKIDLINDVCLISRPNHSLIPVKLTEKTKIHEPIFVVGAPMGFFGTTYEGRVIKTSDLGGTFKDKLIISASSAPGNSGSAVFNSNNEVIGIVVMGNLYFDSTTILTKAKYVLDLMK